MKQIKPKKTIKQPVRRVATKKRPTVKKAGPRKSAATKRVTKTVPVSRAVIMWEAFAYEVRMINAELSVNSLHGGHPPNLFDSHTLATTLLGFKNQETIKNVASMIHWYPDTLENALKKSKSLTALVSHAKDHFRRLALAALEDELMIVEGHYIKKVNPITKEEEAEWVPRRRPPQDLVRYILEHPDFGRFKNVAVTEKNGESGLTFNDNRTFFGERAEAYEKLQNRVLNYGTKATKTTTN